MFRLNITAWLQVWLPIIISGLIFIVVVLQAYIYKKQLEAMKEQITLSTKQVEAMQAQTNAMKSGLEETRKIVIQNDRAVAASEAQAKTSELSVRVSERNAETTQDALYVSERAYVGIANMVLHVTDDEPTLLITWVNGGKTPAWHFRAMPILVLGEKPEANKIYSIDDDYSTDIGGNFLPAGAKRKFPYLQGSEVRITNEVLKELTSGKKRLYAIGSAYYVDFRGRQQTYPIEAIYDISESKFIETYQYADQKKPS